MKTSSLAVLYIASLVECFIKDDVVHIDQPIHLINTNTNEEFTENISKNNKNNILRQDNNKETEIIDGFDKNIDSSVWYTVYNDKKEDENTSKEQPSKENNKEKEEKNKKEDAPGGDDGNKDDPNRFYHDRWCKQDKTLISLEELKTFNTGSVAIILILTIWHLLCVLRNYQKYDGYLDYHHSSLYGEKSMRQEGYKFTLPGKMIVRLLVLYTVLCQIVVFSFVCNEVCIPMVEGVGYWDNRAKPFFVSWLVGFFTLLVTFLVKNTKVGKNLFLVRTPLEFCTFVKVSDFNKSSSEHDILNSTRDLIRNFIIKLKRFFNIPDSIFKIPFEKYKVVKNCYLPVITKDDERYFVYHYVKYTYNNEYTYFLDASHKVNNYLKNTNLVHLLDNGGLTEYESLKRTADIGFNEISVEKLSFWTLLYREVSDPVFFMQLYLTLKSIYWRSYISAPIWGSTTLYTIFKKVKIIYDQQNDIYNLTTSSNEKYVTVMRDNITKKVMIKHLAVGDIVRVENDWEVPSDMIMLRGDAIVDESSITGESIPLKKRKIDLNKYYNYKSNIYDFLYNKRNNNIEQTNNNIKNKNRKNRDNINNNSNKDNNNKNTNREYTKEEKVEYKQYNDNDDNGNNGDYDNNEDNYTEYHDDMDNYNVNINENLLKSGTKVISVLGNEEISCSAVAVVIATGVFTTKGKQMKGVLFPNQFRLKYDTQLPLVFILTFIYALFCSYYQIRFLGWNMTSIFYSIGTMSQVVPVWTSTIISISQSKACQRLSKTESIYCIAPSRIAVCGKVRVMCFDKTGTLTNNKLMFNGSKYFMENTLTLLKPKKIQETLNSLVDLEFFNKPEKDQTVISLAVATCHSLWPSYTPEQYGNHVDKSMFNCTGCFIHQFIDGQGNNKRFIINKKNEKLVMEVLNTFDFDYQKKLSSVVVEFRVQKDRKRIVFVKGAFENLSLCCNNELENLSMVSNDESSNGSYVLGLAYKVIDDGLDISDRNSMESNLTMISLLIFHNQVRFESMYVIKTLNEAMVRSVILTGDNIPASQYVAKMCKLIKRNTKSTHLTKKDSTINLDGDIGDSNDLEDNIKINIDNNNRDNKEDNNNNNNNSNNKDNTNNNKGNNNKNNSNKDNNRYNVDNTRDNNSNNSNDSISSYSYNSITMVKFNEDIKIYYNYTDELGNTKEEKEEIDKINEPNYEEKYYPIAIMNNNKIEWKYPYQESDEEKLLFSDEYNEISMTGEVFDYIENNWNEILLKYNRFSTNETNNQKLFEHFLMKIRIFARLNPNQKVRVINSFKRLGIITGMCGDGTNDCMALQASHAGISLTSGATSMVSPFSSMSNKLESVIYLIREGRGSLVTCLACFKFMLLFGLMIAFVKVTLFRMCRGVMPEWGYLLIENAIMLLLSFTMALSRPSEKLRIRSPTSSLLGPLTLISVGLMFFINIVFLGLLFKLYVKLDIPTSLKYNSSKPPAAWWILSDNFEAPTVCLWLCYQVVNTALVFSFGGVFRESIFRNTYFTTVWFVINGFLTFLLFSKPSRITCLFRINCTDEVSRKTAIPILKLLTTSASGLPFHGEHKHNVLPKNFKVSFFVLNVVNSVLNCIIAKSFFSNTFLMKVRSFIGYKCSADRIKI